MLKDYNVIKGNITLSRRHKVKQNDTGHRAYAPGGDEINEAYWMKMIPSVNLCGEKLLDIYLEFRGTNPYHNPKVEEASMKIGSLMKRFGDVPFGVNITVFAEYIPPLSSAFAVALHSFSEEMPDDIQLTVERLRYLNTRVQNKMKEVTNLLKMS